MTLAELNESIETGDVSEIIRVAEARQVKAISRLADEICAQPGVRLVPLAGASSAGKTTTAKRLATQLRVNDRVALHLSTDDYFVDNLAYPRDENGELDYEHVACVDAERLVADLSALMASRPVHLRRFDFVTHRGTDAEQAVTLPPDAVIVLEGIHALNPQLTPGISEEAKFGVFVAPQPSIELLPGLRPTAADARLLRRLVRDNRFRKVAPDETFGLWPKVLAGEKRWIEPFRAQARGMFDSYLVYELAALRPYVGGLLVRAHERIGDNPTLVRLVHILEHALPLAGDKIPGDSIIRETIGGSQLDY